MKKIAYEIWVCLDCVFTLEGLVDESPDMKDTTNEILKAHGTLDITRDARCENCEDEEVGCGLREFYTGSCEGCGSGLYGHRSRYVVWH